MTVCVASISTWIDDDKISHPIVVLASDRMITVRRKREYELRDLTKTFWLTDSVGVLVSGDPDSLLLVCQEAWRAIRDNNVVKVSKMVSIFAECYRKARRAAIEAEFFQPFGLTIEDFIRQQKTMEPDFRERFTDAIDDPENDLGEVIVAGQDDEGAHIYTVGGVGTEHCWNAGGYVAIGSGSELAEAVFMAAQYTPSRFWVEALVLTHAAKRRAEEAPGVGRATDLYYILPKTPNTYFAPLSALVIRLDEIFDKRLAAERQGVIEDAVSVMQFFGESNARATQEAQDIQEAGPDSGTDDSQELPDGTGEGQSPSN